MSRKQSKGSPTDFFHTCDLILGLITKSLVADTSLEELVSAINVKYSAPSRISNGKAKTNMAHKKGTFNNMVANSRHSIVTTEYLLLTLNI